MAARRSLFLSSKQLFLLGTPIGASPSPDMHNAAFQRIGLPWNYGLFDTPDVAKCVRCHIGGWKSSCLSSLFTFLLFSSFFFNERNSFLRSIAFFVGDSLSWSPVLLPETI